MRQQQPAKRGQMILYLALLAIVVAFMVALSMCDKPLEAPGTQASGGDTLDIAIEYSPVTYYTYDDTLGGYNYDLLRLMSEKNGCPMKFHPIVTLEKAIAGLADGRYDVLVAQFPMTAGPTPSTSTSRCWCSAATVKPSIPNWTWLATRFGLSRVPP